MIISPPSRFLAPPVGAKVKWSDPITRGLVGYWLFNQRSGSFVKDITGNGWDLTPGTVGTWHSGPMGPGMQFTAAGLQYMRTASVPLSAYPVTLIVWFSQITAGTYMTPMWIGDTATGSNFFGFDASAADGTTRYWHRSEASSQNESFMQVLPYDPVVMLAGVSPSTTVHRFYSQGVLRDSGTAATNMTGWDYLCFGRMMDSTPSNGNSRVYAGAIFNRALAADEIMRLFTDPFAMVERPAIIHVGLVLGGSTYNEMVSVWADAAASVADTQASIESVSTQADAATSSTDTLHTGEIVAVTADAVASATDTLVAAEVVVATATAEASQSDTAVFVEAVAATAGAQASATDTSAPSEIVSVETQAVGSAVDTVQFVDSVTAQAAGEAAAIDVMQTSESVSCEATIVSLVVDTVTFTETVSAGAQAECSALDSNAPSEIVSADVEATASAVDSLICVEAVAVSAGADASAVDVAAWGEIVAAECFGVATAVDLAVFTESVLAETDAVGSAVDVVPAGTALIQAFLLIQKTR